MAVDGGRQLEPIPGERVHEIPGQRAPGAEESYRTAGLGATAVAPEGTERQANHRGPAGIGLPPR
ncbi:MAG TPA: hypothetical protein VMA72_24885 [Streptosporangiaceae bacterium]|nr:hypothetical protein [Streptosporangiaceae bacterium]